MTCTLVYSTADCCHNSDPLKRILTLLAYNTYAYLQERAGDML